VPVNYPKFDKKVQEQIDLSQMRTSRSRPGVIAAYDKASNTATIILDEQYSETMGSVIKDVPCPISRGVQLSAPTLGTRCLVGFRDNNEASPYVLNFFEDNVSNRIYNRNYFINTGIPRFMVR
jgi:hypothetical protein